MFKKSISAIIAILLVTASVATLFSCELTYNYVDTVKKYIPFQDDGVTTEFGTVVDKYIDSPEWASRTEGGTEYVDLKGIFKGGEADQEEPLVLTFKLTPIEGQEGMFMIEPYSIQMEGADNDSNAAGMIVWYMYSAYEGGYASVYDYLGSFGE
ncbi:MAG: hypothetical protein FWH48_09580 [Oscillospiraceae bacterium]|nr:hypothetical protein [Oscillospiraceae bacterium]